VARHELRPAPEKAADFRQGGPQNCGSFWFVLAHFGAFWFMHSVFLNVQQRCGKAHKDAYRAALRVSQDASN
jgi:hypothetical protein